MSIAQQLDRVPPQNLEAEQGVLGSMLLDRDAIARVLEALRPEDFYRDAHRVIFAAMIDLFERGEPVDLITITNRLSVMGKIEDVGGATYLASLPNVVPTAANVDYYASIVLEKSMLRSLINAGTHIAALGYEGADEVASLIDQAEKLVFGIAARRNVQDFQAIKEILKESFEKIDKRYQEKGTVTGVPTSFTDLDMMTSGLQASDMVIVAARPSVGKCLAGDAEIVLSDGSIATIEQIVRRRRASLLTLGADWKLRLADPSAFVDDGIKPVFRVTTRLGRTIECTASHPFLTVEGWLPVAALRVGERVAVPRRVGVFGRAALREPEVTLLAYATAGVPLTRGSAAIARTHPHVSADCARAIREFGAARRRGGPGPRSDAPILPALADARARAELGRWLERCGLGGPRRCVPGAVFTLPRHQLALYLNRLFAVGGRAAAQPGGQPRIAYTTTEERLARQVQHLLLRFDILAGLRARTVLAGEARRSTWQLDILDPASLWLFAREIGIFGRQAQLNRVIAALTDGSRRPNDEVLSSGVWQARAAATAAASRGAGAAPAAAAPRNASREGLLALAQTLRPGALAQIAASDVYWDEIVSIEPAGSRQVYDLTIPVTHNFVANDVCVHNTTFALNIAQQAALSHKIPVAIFSLETSKEQLVQRILCAEAQVDNTKLRTGFLADEDWRKLARAMGGLSEAPIYIDDSATLSVVEMRAKARKLKAEHGLGLIVIDYIQLIQSFRRTENRTQELSEIARNIKSLAKELDIPIIAISQLSRAVEALGQKRPMLSHLRECVAGSTAVWDPDDGREYAVADLARRARWPRLLSLDRAGRLVAVRPAAVLHKGPNHVFEVRTEADRRLRATAKHPVLTPDGWRALGDVTPGTAIAAARSLPAVGADRADLRRVATLRPARRAEQAHAAPGRGGRSGLALAERDGACRDDAAESPVAWDRVISITPRGEEPVYDLVMPGTHNFLANGLVVHNSGEIEQVSDLVLFLYREDYYDQEKAQKENKENICEVIIAKHRNGPIGTVELYFHKEHSRFDNLAKQR